MYLYVDNWHQISSYSYEVLPIAIVSKYKLIPLTMWLILMGVTTRPAMAQGEDDKAVTYVNSKTSFGSLGIVKGVDRLIYISDTNMVEGHR